MRKPKHIERAPGGLLGPSTADVGCERPSRIEAMHCRTECEGGRIGGGVQGPGLERPCEALLLVACPPHSDGRVAAIALDQRSHRRQVAIVVDPVLIIAERTKRVKDGIQSGAVRVVAEAREIRPKGARRLRTEEMEPLYPIHGRAQARKCVVVAEASELGDLAIQPKPVVHAPAGRAESAGYIERVHHLGRACIEHLHEHAIQGRPANAPQAQPITGMEVACGRAKGATCHGLGIQVNCTCALRESSHTCTHWAICLYLTDPRCTRAFCALVRIEESEAHRRDGGPTAQGAVDTVMMALHLCLDVDITSTRRLR